MLPNSSNNPHGGNEGDTGSEKSSATSKYRPPQRPPDWKLPPGVAPGTWDYTHAPSIADQYDDFLNDTKLTRFDLQFVGSILPQAAREGSLVADLGCGTGRTQRLLRSKGYQVLGIDLSQPMLVQFRRKSLSDGGCWGLRANLVTLDCIADQTIDHAVCLFSSLGMIRGHKNRQRALEHFHRILKPAGLLFLHVHNRWVSLRDPGGATHLVKSWWRGRGEPEWDFGDRVYGYRGLPNMFLHSYSRRELLFELRQAGFVIRQLLPLTVHGDRKLPWSRIGTNLRAGGFMAVAQQKLDT